MRLYVSRLRPLLLLFVLAAGTACAAQQGRNARPRHRADAILADEIERASATNAYELVQQLRPTFFRSRGAESITNPTPPTPVVYLDEVRYGSIADLRNIPASNVLEIHYLSAIDATSRFGTGHTGGAILVKTKTR
jgi:hypothetical protein